MGRVKQVLRLLFFGLFIMSLFRMPFLVFVDPSPVNVASVILTLGFAAGIYFTREKKSKAIKK